MTRVQDPQCDLSRGRVWWRRSMSACAQKVPMSRKLSAIPSAPLPVGRDNCTASGLMFRGSARLGNELLTATARTGLQDPVYMLLSAVACLKPHSCCVLPGLGTSGFAIGRATQSSVLDSRSAASDLLFKIPTFAAARASCYAGQDWP